jgi:hypothetical protein
MKKILIAVVIASLFSSCQAPFQIQTSDGVFSKNEDGAIFFKFNPVVTDQK